ncbi:MAG TPA: hypothetical protein VGD58_25605 [Herpetosiphonaceae bacterium]
MNKRTLGTLALLLGLCLATTTARPASAQATCLGFMITIFGGAGSDLLVGGAGNDVIHGFGGDDDIYGGGGNDIICGGTGDDFLDGEGDNDLMNGGPGNDVFADQGGSPSDSVDYRTSAAGVTVYLDNSMPSIDGLGGFDAFDNVENAYGSSFDDTLNGDIFANVLSGRDGDDTLNGGPNADNLIGGAGFDIGNGGLGADTCTVEAPSSC